MSVSWFLVVLAAAFLHAGWNMLLKGGRGNVAFNVIMLSATAALYLPAFLIMFDPADFPRRAWLCVAASGAVHALYFTMLSLSYSRADLSLAYPVARGSGAALAAFGSTVLLGERPDAMGWAGITVIFTGLALLWTAECTGEHGQQAGSHRGRWRGRTGIPGLGWAVGTGVTIATYSVIDKVGVSVSHPFTYVYMVMAIAAAIVVLASLGYRGGKSGLKEGWCQQLIGEWNRSGIRAIAAGFFMLLTYLLVLFAMRASKLSYVAPLRESSVLFSMLLGSLVLKERMTARRLVAGGTICLGVVLLALAR